MFHRECGYYKTSYQADQAILPFPIAKQAIIGFLLFFGVIMPAFGSEYYLAQLSLVGIACVGVGLPTVTTESFSWPSPRPSTTCPTTCARESSPA